MEAEAMSGEAQRCHVIQRTSPFGEAFIGECMLCGASGLTLFDALLPCENLLRITEDDALISAIEGEPAQGTGGGS
jgi:hypothetical protein